MSAVDKDIEKLIVRYLDGEVNADEEVELNREILRNPQAHRLLEEYRRIDEFSSAVLDHVVPEKDTAIEPAALRWSGGARRTGLSHLAWWLLPGAVAAAVVVAVVSRPGLMPKPASVTQEWPVAGTIEQGPFVSNGEKPTTHRVSDIPSRRRVIRDIDRNVFGVIDESGNIYWIEVDRTRTIKRPDSQSASKRRAGEL